MVTNAEVKSKMEGFQRQIDEMQQNNEVVFAELRTGLTSTTNALETRFNELATMIRNLQLAQQQAAQPIIQLPAAAGNAHQLPVVGRNNREHPNFQNRHHEQDMAGDITKKVKVDVPNFEGNISPAVFSDWLHSIESYFDCVEYELERAGLPPTSTWQDLKARLREKYMPFNYLDKMREQAYALRQGSMSVTEYMQKFEELTVRSQLKEDNLQTMARFKAGLRVDTRRELFRQHLATLDHIFQVSLDIEEGLNQPPPKQFGIQAEEAATQKGFGDNRDTKFNNSQPYNRSNNSKPSFSNGTNSKNRGNECFKCGESGHMAYQCPKKQNLFIKEKRLDEEGASQDPNLDEFEGYEDDDLQDEGVDSTFLSVVRRILTAPKAEKEEDWRRTSIFQTLVHCGDQPKKLIIDGWLGSTTPTIPVTRRCLVSFKCGGYSDSILCDIVPMHVTHILLGRPWLYDHNVHHNGKENSYSFSIGKTNYVMKPMSSLDIKKYKNGCQPSTKMKGDGQKKYLNILTKKKFEVENKNINYVRCHCKGSGKFSS
ncbi:uncharacterized protein LOC126687661 [Mercurialis annua]|uniref:uncharacterized protein LOC126687661 n=1 Tax=Mercurialis annua TaxID=3986 RepID=UPI002160B36A|nr:uncharacterized protein LOC126687661 [Mercurialis annua]